MKKIKINKGITLIALLISIIIILILAGISVSMVTGDNGIIINSKKAGENAEIEEEKEIVDYATIQAINKNKFGIVVKENLEKKLESYAKDREFIVYEDNENFVVKFIDTNRYYQINKDGNINQINIEFDQNPGDFAKNQNGETLAGNIDEPYEISSIEDLCAFSNYAGTGNWRWSSRIYAILTKDLDFKSELSYVNGYIGTEGSIPSCSSIEELMTLMTSGEGFYPITYGTGFSVVFDGNYKSIVNLYENRSNLGAGLFGKFRTADIKNLTVKGKIYGTGDAGGIVGGNENGVVSISNCISEIDFSKHGSGTLGGIIGITSSNGNEAKIVNCISYSNKGYGFIGWDWARRSKIYNSITTGKNDYAILKNIYTGDSIELINTLSYGNNKKYKNGTISKMINNFIMHGSVLSDIPENVVEYSKEHIQSQEFINEMNSFIQNGKYNIEGENDEITEETIDTTGWAKWVLDKKGYPTLDLKTLWNGSDWVENN